MSAEILSLPYDLDGTTALGSVEIIQSGDQSFLCMLAAITSQGLSAIGTLTVGGVMQANPFDSLSYYPSLVIFTRQAKKYSAELPLDDVQR